MGAQAPLGRLVLNIATARCHRLETPDRLTQSALKHLYVGSYHGPFLGYPTLWFLDPITKKEARYEPTGISRTSTPTAAIDMVVEPDLASHSKSSGVTPTPTANKGMPKNTPCGIPACAELLLASSSRKIAGSEVSGE